MDDSPPALPNGGPQQYPEPPSIPPPPSASYSSTSQPPGQLLDATWQAPTADASLAQARREKWASLQASNPPLAAPQGFGGLHAASGTSAQLHQQQQATPGPPQQDYTPSHWPAPPGVAQQHAPYSGAAATHADRVAGPAPNGSAAAMPQAPDANSHLPREHVTGNEPDVHTHGTVNGIAPSRDAQLRQVCPYSAASLCMHLAKIAGKS